MADSIIELVDELLNSYTLDEAGENQRVEYLNMGDLDKLQLFINTITLDYRDLEDLSDSIDTNLIILFNKHKY